MLNVDKQLKEYAKKLTVVSLDEGVVSKEKVGAVLEILRSKNHPKLKRILKLYLIYIRRELGKSEAILEYAGEISDESVKNVEEEFSKRYNRKINIIKKENPELIAGLRVIIGDDIFDNSAISRLNALSNAVR